MLQTTGKKSAKLAKGWAIQVQARLADSSTLPSVYCGFIKAQSGAVSYFPCLPSFGNVHIGVFDLGANKMYGNAFAHTTIDGGNVYVIAFNNESGKPETIHYHLANIAGLPEGSSATVFNAETQQYEEAVKTSSTVAVDANSTVYRWLLVGSPEYLAKARIIAPQFKLLFAGTYPNPFRSMVHIRYGLPYSGVDKVKFLVYDLLGRTIWQKEVSCMAQYGKNEVLWNAKSNDGRNVAAGIYFIKMVAFNNKQKPVGVFERKMTFIP
jgi:hypothetical protein